MFKILCYTWGASFTPSDIADKVKHFFKMTMLTPSYHAEVSLNQTQSYTLKVNTIFAFLRQFHFFLQRQSYPPEDKRLDLRQFLYKRDGHINFAKNDKLVQDKRWGKSWWYSRWWYGSHGSRLG